MDINNIANNSSVFPPEQRKSVSFNENGNPIIKVIGVGGGGNNAVNYMYNLGIEGVSFVITNTDRQALGVSPVPNKLLLGPTVTCGLGAGNVPEKAKRAAEESEDEIAELFDEDTKMVFITAGMGGGTGTGAAPVVARIAREKGKLTIGIVTIPFLFEGDRKILKALDGAKEMSKYVDAMLVINNERLTEIYSDLDFDNAFSKADDTLAVAAKSISDIINKEGKINLDLEDVKTTLQNGGTAIISSGYGEGENRVTKAIEDALNSPLLKNRDIQSSKRFLFNLYYSPTAERKFIMGEMNEITKFMTNFARDIDVIWGNSFDESLGDKVKITILASGFDVSMNGEFGKINFDKPVDEPKTVAEKVEDNDKRIADEYGTSKIAERDQLIAKNRYILLEKDQMDDDTLINFIEKNPTFKRGNESALREEWKTLVSSSKEEKEEKPTPSSTGGNTIFFS